ncbi:MAG: tetratricopeptide repeat protein, partial [Gammaproteobacteria bacterium]
MFALNGTVSAAEFDDGVAAYKAANYPLALAIFNEHATRGDPRAQFALGLMIDNGEGVAADPKTALEWFTKSADQGYAKAQYQLGLMTLKGRGVVRDDTVAREWFAQAAEAGDPSALSRYRQFAEDGDIEAQY